MSEYTPVLSGVVDAYEVAIKTVLSAAVKAAVKAQPEAVERAVEELNKFRVFQVVENATETQALIASSLAALAVAGLEQTTEGILETLKREIVELAKVEDPDIQVLVDAVEAVGSDSGEVEH